MKEKNQDTGKKDEMALKMRKIQKLMGDTVVFTIGVKKNRKKIDLLEVKRYFDNDIPITEDVPDYIN
ncbi:MAG: hypothetical protein Q7J54_02435 [Candidatus Woesearchaeota archaeon]|nr:hypothetical protein [Candidatus Woesearchaeota archaeon]